MVYLPQILSSLAYAVGATIFFKKSFKREGINIVVCFILLGVILAMIESLSVIWTAPALISTTAALCFSCYKNADWLPRAISGNVFLSFLFAILDTRFGLATFIWAKLDGNLMPSDFEPSWGIYRLVCAATVQFVRRPLWLKTSLQGTRSILGPIYVMCVTHYVLTSTGSGTSFLQVFLGFLAAILANLAGLIFRPDNSTMMELLVPNTTLLERRRYHRFSMICSFTCFIFLFFIAESRLS